MDGFTGVSGNRQILEEWDPTWQLVFVGYGPSVQRRQCVWRLRSIAVAVRVAASHFGEGCGHKTQLVEDSRHFEGDEEEVC